MNTNQGLLRRKRQRGFGLVEVSVAVGIVAVCCAVLLQYIGKQVQGSAEVQSQDLLARAQKSLVAYTLLQGRLPCPAASKDGREACDRQEGFFPFLTVGLPEKDAGKLLYRLGSNTSGLTAPKFVDVLSPISSAAQDAVSNRPVNCADYADLSGLAREDCLSGGATSTGPVNPAAALSAAAAQGNQVDCQATLAQLRASSASFTPEQEMQYQAQYNACPSNQIQLVNSKQQDLNAVTLGATPANEMPTLNLEVGNVSVDWLALKLPEGWGRPLALCQVLASKGLLTELAFQLRPDTNVPLASVFAGANQSVSYAQLLDRLHCEDHAVIAARAHINAYLATTTFLRAVNDYMQEREYIKTMLSGDVIGLSYSVVNAAWTSQRAIPATSNALSEWNFREMMDGGAATSALLQFATFASDSVNIARHITNLTRMSLLFANNNVLLEKANASKTQALALNTDIQSRAFTSISSSFLYTGIAP